MFDLVGGDAENKDHSHAWAPHHMKLKECASWKEVIFGANVYIDHIEYIDTEQHPNYITPITMHQKVNFQWNLNQNEVNVLKTLEPNQIVGSELFDDGNWALACAPNGEKLGSKGQVAVGLCLYHMPFGVKYMHVRVTLKCIETKVEWTEDNFFKLNNKWKPWPVELMKMEELNDLDHVTFTVSLEILHLISDIDAEVKVIPKEEWSELGVIKAIDPTISETQPYSPYIPQAPI